MEPLTLKQYMDNPMGKGSTVFNKKVILGDLDSRYNKLLTKHKSFKTFIWIDKLDFYILTKIPSETYDDIYYDVLFKFTEPDNTVRSDTNLNRYLMYVFSNSPSFVYTYANVYYRNGLLVDFLENKYKSEVINDNPVIRNPNDVINYEKSIYYCCKYLIDKNLLNKVTLGLKAKKFSIKEISNEVKDTDTILLDIKKSKRKVSEAKKKEISKQKSAKKEIPIDNKRRSTTTTNSNISVRTIKPKPKVTSSVQKKKAVKTTRK